MESVPEVIISKPRFNLRLVILIVALLILGGVGGYFLSRYYTFLPISSPTSPTTPQTELSTTSGSPTINPILQNQSAVINGKILSLADGKLTLEDNNGQTASFVIAPKIVIYKQIPGVKSSNTSTDIRSIQFNTKALIVLTAENGVYKVSSILYSLPPSLPVQR